MKPNKHRAWAEISLHAIEHNYKEICAKSCSPVLCVVKADAYGHGAVRVARCLQAAGAPYFATATVFEAIELRQNGIETPILILGYIAEEDMETVARERITATVYSQETAELLSAAAVRAKCSVAVHFKVDTGMTRLGFDSWQSGQAVADILFCASLDGLRPEGIFTHFSVADELNGADFTHMQYERFSAVCNGLAAQGLELPLRHCANSGAIQSYADTHCTMTRAGIILYGYRPDPALPEVLDLRPAMTVKARIVQVRDIPAHTAISYGRTYETDSPTRVAVVSMGYADGYLRTGSGRAQVLLNGEKTPVLGRICMDMCMISVPEGVSVHQGDEVTLFGADKLTADDVAAAAGTISYEVLCALSLRVPQFYED